MTRIHKLCSAMVILMAVAACSDSIVTPAELEPQLFLGPEACAEWSCNELVCGSGNTPCCTKSIYDYPYSYEEPGPTQAEPECDSGSCLIQDNSCFWVGDPENGTCHFDEGASCDLTCGESAPCRSDPVTWSSCTSITDYEECGGS